MTGLRERAVPSGCFYFPSSFSGASHSSRPAAATQARQSSPQEDNASPSRSHPPRCASTAPSQLPNRHHTRRGPHFSTNCCRKARRLPPQLPYETLTAPSGVGHSRAAPPDASSPSAPGPPSPVRAAPPGFPPALSRLLTCPVPPRALGRARPRLRPRPCAP